MYAQPRSAREELHQGMVEGKYKQVSPNRGGEIDSATWRARSSLYDTWTGIHEAAHKCTPDCRGVITPTY